MENHMNARRNFLAGAGLAGAGMAGLAIGGAAVSRAAIGAVPEATLQASAATQAPLAPASGRPYSPVVTLNG